MRTSRLIVFGILAVMMSGCSCRFYIRQASKKCPELFDSTVVRVDTVIIETAEVDTVFRESEKDTTFLALYDTVLRDVIKVKYLRRVDSVYINVKCPDAKVITEYKTVKVTEPLGFWQKVILFFKGLGIFVFVAMCVFLTFKIIKHFRPL
jgi:phage FluMu protein Com